jgi:hypothetical protein
VAASAAGVKRIGSEMDYDPVIIADEDGDALSRYVELAGRSREPVDTTDVTAATIELARACWMESDFIMLYSDYDDGLAAAPLASYYNIPMVYANGSAPGLKGLMKELKCDYAISAGDAPVADVPTMGISYDSSITLNEFYLWCLASTGTNCDYVVLTNPDDIHNDWGESGIIPAPGHSTAAAQVAAYRNALVFFTEGYKQGELGVNFEDHLNYNQMGAEVEVANAYADMAKENVQRAQNMTEAHGGALAYVGIVGDPVGVPYHYEFIEPDPGSDTTFQNTNFIASDYFFAELGGDEHQDIAFGRILGRSVTDTSLLCARSLGFDEYGTLTFEQGNDVSERFYETFSEDWKANAGVFVGSSKPVPMPGALKHMKKYHYDVLTRAGMFVTGEESLRLNDITAAETLDKMNYLMYCGHGNSNSWACNYADRIDAAFVATQKLKPGLAAVMACDTGRVDNLDDSSDYKCSQAFIHAGLNGYIGASRLAYGLFKGGDGEQGGLLDTGALYLVDRISNHFAAGGISAGELLLSARNELIDKYGTDPEDSEGFEAMISMWEYVLYGDPAWVPA